MKTECSHASAGRLTCALLEKCAGPYSYATKH